MGVTNSTFRMKSDYLNAFQVCSTNPSHYHENWLELNVKTAVLSFIIRVMLVRFTNNEDANGAPSASV